MPSHDTPHGPVRGLNRPDMSGELIRWKDHSLGTSLEYPSELRERAVRLVIEVRGDHPTENAAIRSVASKLGITSPESLRKWLRQAEIDGGIRPGKTTEEIAEIKSLKIGRVWGLAPLRQVGASLRACRLLTGGQGAQHRSRQRRN